MRFSTSCLAAIGLLFLHLGAPANADTKVSDFPQERLPEVAEYLREGGNLIIIRHAQKFEEGSDAAEARHAFDAADAGLATPILVPEEYQPGTGMCLSPVGKATAWLQGEIFRQGNFKAGTVIASATCRTRQHADIMFEGQYEVEPAMIFGGVTLASQVEETHARKKELMAEWDLSENVIVIGHGKTAQEAGLIDFWPLQGDALIFRRGTDGSLELVAHLSPKLLVHLLEPKSEF